MSFLPTPPSAAWLHQDARSGFEVAYFAAFEGGWRAEGWTTAVEEGETWVVRYDIRLDAAWTTRRAEVWGRSVSGERSTVVEADGAGRWLVDGRAAPQLDGCFDVDLESSAMTNAFPVHRMALPVGARAEAPAAYVRAVGLGVERLEQSYERLANEDTRQRYDYAAPVFDFACHLVYDESGLVLDYPGIATRAH
ncbi:hypothetical protein Aple_070350 [Acrocarpospora pleiomorpha]|uniref:Glycolipid-binding domain-containing protein n=1 Tax=Acrocarpospora pleiomorpha TaxID=90975 RepID=A0A5M3XTF8_9ACTN|nr:putative glycolipid-binding domain-containing protein [Acrocarpospora pleiomorpha]GES24136.1 hypothetical protein Aple_070350 [Acrocarpospora pleiomorpha]